MLVLREVCYRYAGREALDGVSLDAESGELIALTGINGSGKSTLLKLIARVMRPQQGTIAFEGRPTEEWPARHYARRVGYLAQDIDVTFPMRALDAVVSGRAPFLRPLAWEGDLDFAAAEQALRLCDASHLGERYLDAMSGGERKRVLMARVLAAQPSLILLDEPFASLDIAHVQQISALLRSIVNETGATVIFATHDLNWAAAFCDRMLVMRDGKLAAQGRPEDLFHPELIERFFGFRAQAVRTGSQTWLVPR